MISEQHFIKMRDNIELHAQIQEVGAPVWLIVTHGIGEHLNRHLYLKDIAQGKFNILFYDLRGHGLSMGEGAYISDFFEYMEDLKEVLEYLKERYKMERFVLFGHSMGALITAGLIQRYLTEELSPELVYLNAPPVGFYGPLGKIVEYAPRSVFSTLSKLPLSVRLGGMVDLNYLSHDVRVKDEYIKDTRNHLELHSKLVLELVRGSGEVFSRPLRPDCPAYVSYGTDDRVIGVKQLKQFFNFVEKSFEVKEFHGAYHEIHNEIEKYRKPYFDYVTQCLHQVFN
jgi:acylglycerol lipase